MKNQAILPVEGNPDEALTLRAFRKALVFNRPFPA